MNLRKFAYSTHILAYFELIITFETTLVFFRERDQLMSFLERLKILGSQFNLIYFIGYMPKTCKMRIAENRQNCTGQ